MPGTSSGGRQAKRPHPWNGSQTRAPSCRRLQHGVDLATVRGARPMRDLLARFYEAHDFKPVWSGSAEAAGIAGEVRATLRKAYEQGLRTADYAVTASRWGAAPAAGREAAEYDLSLTADLLRYAHDVRVGRTRPGHIPGCLKLPKSDFDAAQALNEALQRHSLTEFLADLPPPHREYRRLVVALARYRATSAKAGTRQRPLSRLPRTWSAGGGCRGRSSAAMSA